MTSPYTVRRIAADLIPAHRRAWAAKLLRYGAVSVIATSTSLVILGVLVSTTTIAAGWANVLATAVGTIPSFELNRRWVWGRTGRRSVGAEIGPFCVLSFAGLALSTLTVSLAAAWATSAGLSGAARTAVIELANVAAFGTLWVIQYLVLDRVLFAHRTAPLTGDGVEGSTAVSERPTESSAAALVGRR